MEKNYSQNNEIEEIMAANSQQNYINMGEIMAGQASLRYVKIV